MIDLLDVLSQSFVSAGLEVDYLDDCRGVDCHTSDIQTNIESLEQHKDAGDVLATMLVEDNALIVPFCYFTVSEKQRKAWLDADREWRAAHWDMRPVGPAHRIALDAFLGLAYETRKATAAYIADVRAGGCPLVTLAEHLQQTGTTTGSETAAALRDNSDLSANTWLVWFNDSVPGLAPYVHYFVRALWVDVVRPQMERAEKNARNVGAVTLGTYGTLEALLFNKNTRVVTNNRQAELFTDEHLTATAHLSDVALVDVLTKATPALRSYAAAQFLVWIIDEVKRRHFLGYQYPNIVTIEGGLGAVADAAELGASKSRESLLRQILTAGKDWNVAWPNGSEVHGLWTFNTTPPAPGKSATVTITVAAALTPHGGGGGILTPIVSVNDLHGITSKNYLGPLAAFKQGVVKAIVDRRLELPKHGGALITDRELAAIAKRCGVPDVVVPRAMQAWQIDRDEGAQFLEVSKGRIHIANNDEYGAVRAFIDETAAIATTRSARGKRGAAKRAKSNVPHSNP